MDQAILILASETQPFTARITEVAPLGEGLGSKGPHPLILWVKGWAAGDCSLAIH